MDDQSLNRIAGVFICIVARSIAEGEVNGPASLDEWLDAGQTLAQGSVMLDEEERRILGSLTDHLKDELQNYRSFVLLPGAVQAASSLEELMQQSRDDFLPQR